ncbi:MAG: hypothetical protein C3F15_17800 [Holophagae bacterium]|nr:MAG: hypothetical protein C3F15_17800 [Holophagae bacterium]
MFVTRVHRRGETQVLCAVALLLLATTAAAQTPKPQAKTVVRPSQAQVVRPVFPQLDVGAAKLPPAWSAPSLRRIIDVLLTDADSRGMYTRSGGVPRTTDVAAGSYAELRPIQIGAARGGRLDGSIHTLLIGSYGRHAQTESNIAYIPIRGVSYQGNAEGQPGTFYFIPESAGWYLFTLHLYNPSPTYTLRSQLDLKTGASLTTVLNRSDTVAEEAEYVLPALLEISAPGLHYILWLTEVQGTANPGLVFRAATVDKIG